MNCCNSVYLNAYACAGPMRVTICNYRLTMTRVGVELYLTFFKLNRQRKFNLEDHQIARFQALN